MGSENYTLGRGELHFDKFAPGTFNKTGERYLGNTPELNRTTESENLDHFNSDRGIRVKDKSIVLEKNDSGTFIADEISDDNIALWFLGTQNVVAQSASASVVQNIPANRVKPGTYIQLGESTANPTGHRNVTLTSVTSNPVGTTFDNLDDYTLDAELGRLYIVPGGAIDGAAPLIVTYATAASTRTSGSTRPSSPGSRPRSARPSPPQTRTTPPATAEEDPMETYTAMRHFAEALRQRGWHGAHRQGAGRKRRDLQA